MKFRFRLIVGEEYQPLSVVSPFVWALAVVGLALQIAFNVYIIAPPTAKAEELSAPPDDKFFRVLSFGDPVALGRVLMMQLQSFDVQPGVSLAFRDLDYGLIGEWLDRIVTLDERAEYPHFSAARVYGAVNDNPRRRQMAHWVRRQFLRKPAARWEWMAHVTTLAKHKLKDEKMALQFARELRENTKPGEAPGWARQMEVFFLENKNEYETAATMLSNLLLAGEVTEAFEFRFLFERLQELLATMGERGEIKNQQEWDKKIAQLEELRKQFLGQFEEFREESAPQESDSAKNNSAPQESAPQESDSAKNDSTQKESAKQ